MSVFELVPVDGGDPIRLPPGETVIGRGPFLGVADKRVSRHHGLLENLNGQLRLKPTHLNPCFVQSSLTDEPRPLQRNSWCALHHGDLFSLLPGQFVYKVAAVGEEESTPRNSQMFEEEPDVEQPPTPPPIIGQHRGQTPPHEEPVAVAPSRQEEADSPESLSKEGPAAAEEAESDRSDVTQSATRSRVLPAWMMQAVTGPHGCSSSSSPKVQRHAATSSKRAAAKKSKEEEEELSKEEMPKKRRKKVHNEEELVQSKRNVPAERPVVQPQSGSNRPDISDESDSFTVEVDEDRQEGPNALTRTQEVSRTVPEDRKLRNGDQTTKRADTAGSHGSSASRPAPASPQHRTPCPYGRDCYRKNPVHFQECSHPGDSDYEEGEEAEETDRPECPYGTDCYRKNPLHRKEYKHTKKPAYNTRPKKTAAAATEDDNEESDDDDSFINDDSEDAGNDSDYAPPESDDSGKEDIRQLQKEAQAFLKKKK